MFGIYFGIQLSGVADKKKVGLKNSETARRGAALLTKIRMILFK